MERYQVIVIGGGGAGLMAAGQAASLGAKTLLLEKMASPGRKIFISGKGRCNITNSAPLPDFITHFGPNGRFLRSAFHRFFAPETLAFFESLGVPTIEERGGRIFPASNLSQDVVDALLTWAETQGAIIKTQTPVNRLLHTAGRITGVSTKRGDFQAQTVIIATGGASYPGTGSTGDGYTLAQSVGHALIPIRPALVPISIGGTIPSLLQGLSLRNVNLSIWVNDKKVASAFGEMIFTHFGVSGPIVLSLSKKIVDALQQNHAVSIAIDLKPALDENKLDQRLLRDFDKHGKRQFQTIIKDLLPRKLIPVCIAQTKISPEKQGHQITSEERKRLRKWLKDFRLPVTGHRSFKQAIVTAGGVDLREVDPRTMASRIIEGLYFAGEVLDIDADTGGYNLQAAFSTGWLAGNSAAVYQP
ncbi:MAG: NAD(P)/FAD-dependent oxidoreductase [Chloroflexota bacterium]